MIGLTDILVVKCGGTAAVRLDHVCAEVAQLVDGGQPVVVVHGGSHAIDRLAARLGVDRRELTSPSGMTNRHTSEEMLEVVTLALAGGVKREIVARLHAAGVRAVGLTGADAGLAVARRKTGRRAVIDGRTVVIRDDHSGRIVAYDPALIVALLRTGFIPVLSPPAIDADGALVNVDADRLAAAAAVALGAAELVLLTGAPGVVPDDDGTAAALDVLTLPAAGVERLPGRGGMRMKLLAAREALAGGAADVRIADGRVPCPVHAARAGRATRIVLAGALA